MLIFVMVDIYVLYLKNVLVLFSFLVILLALVIYF